MPETPAPDPDANFVAGWAAVDLQMHYLSQVKAGPARSRATLLRHAADHAVADVRLVDAGNDDQLLARATVTLRSVRA